MTAFPLGPTSLRMAAGPQTFEAPAVTERSWTRTLRRQLAVLLALGVAWRLLRYVLQFPIWGDEAYVCLNLLDRDLVGLTEPLRFIQVAPVLFLWLEWAAHRLLGDTELALRLVPFLAGVGGLFLFAQLARRMLDPLAVILAVGILAVAYYPVRHSCEVKPYALDLLVATALLWAAASWLRRPERLAPLALLAALVPAALAASYPSVFVAGTVSLVLLPAVWRRPERAARILYLTYNVLLALSFGVLYLVVGTGQYGSTGGADNAYWQGAFPPSHPLELFPWLVLTHTGNLLAYPAGGPSGLSTATFLLCLAGAWRLGRERRWDLLGLCLLPFGLTLLAAALHRYPYGGSARVGQHLAPAICLLAGAGAAGLIRSASAAARPRWASAAVVVLISVGLAGLARDLVRPYKTDGDRTVRRIVDDVFRQAGPDDQIVVVDPYSEMGPTFEWYLRRHPERVTWDGRIDEERAGQVWCLHFHLEAAAPTDLDTGRRMIRVDHARHVLQLGKTEESIERCEVVRWRWMPHTRRVPSKP